MKTLLSFAPLDCERERGVGAAYRAIRMKPAAGYMTAPELFYMPDLLVTPVRAGRFELIGLDVAVAAE